MLSIHFIKLTAMCAILVPSATANVPRYTLDYSVYPSTVLGNLCLGPTAQTGNFETGVATVSGTCQDIKPSYTGTFVYEGPVPPNCTLNVYTQHNCEAGLGYPGLKKSISLGLVQSICSDISVINSTGSKVPVQSFQAVCPGM